MNASLYFFYKENGEEHMKICTFKGGIQPNGRKELTKDKEIVTVLPQEELVFPLSRSGKISAFPLVIEGETVCKGQKIAEENGEEESVYASVSGRVKAIEHRINPYGMKVNSIILENDGLYQEAEYKNEKVKVHDAAEIRFILANLVECEPYVTSTYRRMIENADELVGGMRVLLDKCQSAIGVFCVADDKINCVSKLKERIADTGRMEIRVIKRKYPQENEALLALAALGKKKSKERVFLVSAEELIADYRKEITGEPITERVLTVSGNAVNEPGNFKVLLGTSYRTLIEAAGGLCEDVEKVISGGVMTGNTVATLDVPVTKDTDAIICMKRDMTENIAIRPCIKCGRCVEVCPKGLIPSKLAMFAEKSAEKEFIKWNGTDCIECGCCTYKCPSKRPLKQMIAAMKQNVFASAESEGGKYES